MAVLFLDLDHFKDINDTLGHMIGDQMLLEVTCRLKSCVRESDTLSRLGGDEFVILLPDIPGVGVAQSVAEKILHLLRKVVRIGDHKLHTGCSIGISLYPEEGEDFDTMLKKADTAMYHAKNGGRNAYRFYTEHMNIDALERLQMQTSLRKAIENNEFILHYQPQYDLKSKQICGAEALIRWVNPDGGLIPPNRFVPISEENGLIIPIGEWVIIEACRQLRSWIDSGYEPIVIAINLSAVQFRRGNIVKTALRAAQRYSIDPKYLEFELTESILLHDTQGAIETMRTLKKRGFLLSIDDFGTGYSSLSYLKHFAVDKLKIDQSFVRNLIVDKSDAAIVRSIINLGHSLSHRVIAEGVETQSQMDFLERESCDEVQGYLTGKPIEGKFFPHFLKAVA